jgi:hypothetical protein
MKRVIAREWLIFVTCVVVGLSAIYFWFYFPKMPLLAGHDQHGRQVYWSEMTEVNGKFGPGPTWILAEATWATQAANEYVPRPAIWTWRPMVMVLRAESVFRTLLRAVNHLVGEKGGGAMKTLATIHHHTLWSQSIPPGTLRNP